MEEHTVDDDENQECDKRVENRIACAAEVTTLKALNESESRLTQNRWARKNSARTASGMSKNVR